MASRLARLGFSKPFDSVQGETGESDVPKNCSMFCAIFEGESKFMAKWQFK
jgi:hypothetical protein